MMDEVPTMTRRHADSGGFEVVRVHAAAGVALVRRPATDATRWVAWPPDGSRATETHSPGTEAEEADATDDGSIPLQAAAAREATHQSPCLDLNRENFPDPRTEFQVHPSADGLPAQNVVLFLHGRGDSHVPFARLGAQMALPQTAVISLRAPLVLPFDMGHTWCEDLDAEFNVIPSWAPHEARSRSLQHARVFVWRFLETLRDRYHWRLDRVFLFGFSQGASVAFHVAITAPCRLGGVVLVAGGAVNGPHTEEFTRRDHETPGVLLCGGRDDVFPPSMANETERQFKAAFVKLDLLTRHMMPRKAHDMIRSGDEMRVVMEFFSSHLFLRNIALENRSDLIEISMIPGPISDSERDDNDL